MLGRKDDRAEMPFLDHLEELRWRIFKALGAVVVGTIVGLVVVMQFDAIEVLLKPLCSVIEGLDGQQQLTIGPEATAVGCRLAFLNLTEPFFFILKLGLLTGLLLASPIVIYQIWAFLSPALERHERRVIVPSLFAGLGLFSAGVTLGYVAALPVTIRFLLLFGAEWFNPVLTAGFYLSFVVRLLLVFGIIFELPVVIMILSMMGVVGPEFLRKKRRHAILLIVVAASFVSPGDLIVLTVMLTVPLILLYEASIFLSVLVYRKRERESIMAPTPPARSQEADR